MKFLNMRERYPLRYKKITSQFVFGIKLGFMRKNFVEGGHLTNQLQSMTYISFVSQDRFSILITFPELEDLYVRLFYIGN